MSNKTLIKKEMDRQNTLARLNHLQNYLNWYDKSIVRFKQPFYLDDQYICQRYLDRLEVEFIKASLKQNF